ncbi:MAG: tRNA (adenosine(37)-N6)-threonylcarbamoyltransferase complex dimerization subunit type 1 TsaB [Candidatus Doudnabacteria bacterium]|nr:tRNA (adenosine(37)-N6)-threonylcarbamoyltransferase complex dimerization subunit type 1 TsaB [Candidatus Doudnabacteria bacterium]
MILYIDTTDFKAMRFALVDKVVREQHFEIAYNENWKTLDHLQQFLKKNKVSVAEVTKIIVCSGPGSFTGTRVGVTLAQGLAFANKIPLIAITKDKVPTDLANLASFKGGKKITIEYTSTNFN